MSEAIFVGTIPASENNVEIPVYILKKEPVIIGSLKEYRVELLRRNGEYHGYLKISGSGMWWGGTYPLQPKYTPDERLEILEEVGLVYFDEM